MDGKFRQAEALVAEDSRDYYYESKKPSLRAFRITAIEFAPDLRSAKVSLSSKTEVVIPAAGPTVLDLPFYSNWKLEKGKWCWYIDKAALLITPFGTFKPGGPAAEPPKDAHPATSATVMNAVQVDKDRIRIDPDNPKPQILTLRNTLPGLVSLRSITMSPALKIDFAKLNLSANESTVVTVTAIPGATERPESLTLNVQPMNQVISVWIDWAK